MIRPGGLKRRYKKIIIKRVAVLLIAGVVLMLPGIVPSVRSQAERVGLVTATELHLRTRPGIDSAPLHLLKGGDKVTIVAHQNGWLKIKYRHLTGYIKNDPRYIHILPAVSDPGSSPKGLAATEKKETLKSLHSESMEIGRKIAKRKKQIRQFQQQEDTVISRLNDIDRRMSRLKKQVEKIRTEVSELDAMVAETVANKENLRKKIEKNTSYVVARLTAFYKMSRLGKLHVLASADSVFEMIKRRAALERILDHDEEVRRRLLQDEAFYDDLEKTLKAKWVQRQSLQKTLEEKIGGIEQEKSKRQTLLANIRKEKKLTLHTVSALEQAALNLEDTLRRLAAQPVLDATDSGENQQVFAALKGLLKMPVAGKIVSFFGPYKDLKFNVENFRSGIDIKSDRGEPVRAVCAGRILYADWFKGYGNMIIIDHGQSYYTVYAHLEEIFKSKNDTVEMDEVIATVGETGSLMGPGLYFEIRHSAKPLDPLRWIKSG